MQTHTHTHTHAHPPAHPHTNPSTHTHTHTHARTPSTSPLRARRAPVGDSTCKKGSEARRRLKETTQHRWWMQRHTTLVGFEPTQGDPIGLAGRRLNHSAKVSLGRGCDLNGCSPKKRSAAVKSVAKQRDRQRGDSNTCAQSPSGFKTSSAPAPTHWFGRLNSLLRS